VATETQHQLPAQQQQHCQLQQMFLVALKLWLNEKGL